MLDDEAAHRPVTIPCFVEVAVVGVRDLEPIEYGASSVPVTLERYEMVSYAVRDAVAKAKRRAELGHLMYPPSTLGVSLRACQPAS